MRRKSLVIIVLFLTAAALSACGGGGGGGADPNAPAIVTVTPSKTLALANGNDAVAIQAEVKKVDGITVPDGTTVAFSVPAGTGTLSTASAITTNGVATVTLARAAITGANNETVTVTAASGNASDRKEVKFINQPSSVDVLIAMNPAVTNLGSLDLTIDNTAGASFDNAAQHVAAVNAAFGNTLVLGNFDSAANSTRILLINGTGFNTGTAPIIKATFAVASDGGMPQFSASSTAAISATDPGSNLITPAVSAADMAVTVTFDTEL